MRDEIMASQIEKVSVVLNLGCTQLRSCSVRHLVLPATRPAYHGSPTQVNMAHSPIYFSQVENMDRDDLLYFLRFHLILYYVAEVRDSEYLFLYWMHRIRPRPITIIVL